jgi:hypothetical protein
MFLEDKLSFPSGSQLFHHNEDELYVKKHAFVVSQTLAFMGWMCRLVAMSLKPKLLF